MLPIRVYLTLWLRYFAQIQPNGSNSDTPGTLCKILYFEHLYKKCWKE